MRLRVARILNMHQFVCVSLVCFVTMGLVNLLL